ncbi:MAG: hypothetical protein ABI689_12260 [Thermoanaerobaculia bacterium]
MPDLDRSPGSPATVRTAPSAIDPRRTTLLGIALFLFIPVVLVLFVAHPRPVAASLVGGLALMVGHRFLARPYMLATRPHKCVWCNRFFSTEGDESSTGMRAPRRAVELAQGGDLPPLELLACAAHVARTRRFFAFVDLCRQPLRIGIGLPLGLLLGSLVAFSAGIGDWTESATALFRLSVGLSVHLAALGPWLGAPRAESRAAFPVHNFYLLGVSAILWIFRLVGIWWIVAGGSYWLKAIGLLD